jgi:membrane protein YdbS with pleckstrin-like domain
MIIVAAIVTALMAASIVIPLFVPIFGYKNRFYAVTNKRLIVQKGIMGIDFEFIPIESVQYVSVNVSALDKMIKKGTGTISFATVSAPVTTKGGTKFNFTDIENVYETYKVLKAFIDKSKEKETK